MPCALFRKKGDRADPPPDGTVNLDTSQEERDEWDKVGLGMVLFTGSLWSGSLPDRDDSSDIHADAAALIELTSDANGNDFPLADAIPQAQRNDVIYALPGDGLYLPFEIVDVSSAVMIPAHTRTYLLCARDELGWPSEPTDAIQQSGSTQ